jgi:two-component system, sensor histidine kinase
MLAPGIKHHPRSIHFWLTSLVFASILPVALGAAFLLMQSYQQQRANSEAVRIGLARALVQTVDTELTGAASVLQILAMSPLIASGDFKGFHALASEAVKTTSATHVVLSTPDGHQIIATLKPFGTPLPSYFNDDLQRQTLESGNLVVSGVFISPTAQEPMIALQIPIFIEGKVKFTLAMAFLSKRLNEIMHRQHIADSWVTGIYDRNGLLVARSKAADQLIGKPGAADAVRYVAAHPEGSFDTVTLENTQVHTAFTHSALTGWTVLIAVPTAIATAELWRFLLFNATGTLAMLILGVAVARHIGRRITTSLTKLGTPAQALGSGGDISFPVMDIIEFDRLRTALQTASDLIEQRARERDAAKDAERQMTISAAAAEQASRAKSEFLALITHELRTPLHGILGYAEMMRQEGGLSPLQTRRVDVMLGSGRHLLSMINAVLDLSQIEADQLELRPEPVDLMPLVVASFDLVRPAAEQKGLALVMPTFQAVRVYVDPTRLQQVLLNLLGNAIKFTPAGRVELRFRTTADGAFVRLSVVDTGPGIAARHRDRLFRSFERLERSRKHDAIEGAGLGLALSARLAKLMDGRLGYEDNPGGGSVFWLEVPLHPDNSAREASAETSEAPDALPALQVRHVLVVDDVAMNREIAASFLRKGDYHVTVAEGGLEAVDVASSTDFDVILMDVRMPGIDGLEATRRIRALSGPRGRVPIIALTAQVFADQVAACNAAGMDCHLGKPFTPEDLLALVARTIAAGPAPHHDRLRSVATVLDGAPPG